MKLTEFQKSIKMEGMEAYQCGKLPDDNPYLFPNDLYLLWSEGYREAKADHNILLARGADGIDWD